MYDVFYQSTEEVTQIAKYETFDSHITNYTKIGKFPNAQYK
jgi:hypothetical protein